MRDELVAIDLETTGLDAAQDAIIEVGAVRIRNGEIVDEFSTMVNPDSSIPEHVTHITGIQQQDVQNAPYIEAVLPQISAFVKDAPVIAHNISLDMGFLRDRHKILRHNLTIDTYDLVSVLMPSAPRYNLNSLTQQLGIKLENAHRALGDARATALLYWSLWEKALRLPFPLLQEINDIAQGFNWDSGAVFAAALRESTPELNGEVDEPQVHIVSPAPDSQSVILSSKPERQSLDEQAIVKILGKGGILQQSGLEYRPQQVEVAQAVAEAFSNAYHLMIEAGVGTGRTLGYLVPAILWSIQNQERVVISTYTPARQEQLMTKDIPALREHLGTAFTASVMKGRSHYLCPRRLATVRRRRPTSIEEVLTLAKILVWRLEDDSGDKSNINLRGPAEDNVWERLSAQDERCSREQCKTAQQGMCPFYRAWQAAERANLIVVNHALMISDSNAAQQVLPEYNYAIIDDAHHLEDAITSGLSVHIDKSMLSRRLADLGGINSGVLGEILAVVQKHTPEQEARKFEKIIQTIGEATGAMDTHLHKVFSACYKFLQDTRGARSEYSITSRITRQSHKDTAFHAVISAWETLEVFFEVLGQALPRLAKTLSRQQSSIPELTDLILDIESSSQYLHDIGRLLRQFIIDPETNTVYWFSVWQGADSPVMHAAPLHVGACIDKVLWQDKESVILTSATLRTQDSFRYIRERLFAESVKTLELSSPFNYKDTTLVYIPIDVPEPTDKQGYQQALERGIIELATAIGGRTLVLFTSYGQLRQTSQSITPHLALKDITVYDQSDGSSHQALLEGFKTTPKSVLLGTRVMWEGINIPGDALSALVIVRLPFAVPSDPVFSARSDTYDNPASQYAIPEAVLRFRQGFVPLIRAYTDRGIVVIFDSRILKRGYGADFLDSLPDCEVQKGVLDALPGVAQKWLNLTEEPLPRE